ncbi:MAG: alpha/beta hydrolase [Acidobacteriota bacterium]
MVQRGTGPPLVFVPGIQGRWEWTAPAVKALAARYRVITFSFPGEPGSRLCHDPEAGFNALVRQIDLALDEAGCRRAAICGISFGGLVAATYAAQRPERTSKLVLVSAIGPGWELDDRARSVMAAPWWTTPLLVSGSIQRLYPEIATALPALSERLPFLVKHTARVLCAPMSLARTGDRIRLAASVDAGSLCGRITAPTLVITGEPGADRVMPVEITRRYKDAIANARVATLERTGHIGLVTRPERFAELVADFVGEDAGHLFNGHTRAVAETVEDLSGGSDHA